MQPISLPAVMPVRLCQMGGDNPGSSTIDIPRASADNNELKC